MQLQGGIDCIMHGVHLEPSPSLVEHHRNRCPSCSPGPDVGGMGHDLQCCGGDVQEERQEETYVVALALKHRRRHVGQ